LPSAGLTATFHIHRVRSRCVFFTFRRLLFVCVARKEISERNKRARARPSGCSAARRSPGVRTKNQHEFSAKPRRFQFDIKRQPLLFNCDLLPACSQLYRELVKIASRRLPARVISASLFY
jgi:hypothetical protein